ncbi:4-hydroxy-tetrahydrodipicolinate reductase [Lactobacillus sp. ESL0791]|uniref:4-hydroxy-tetrahydrodipicolinate reductase n=1 Tax=Lactobacillus sp. ESL0791 TaxID=2983234 RepID=UPI0023F73D84|nr:4-hydroxy-tetrahydrodipicolinate reductase [Lactobacillus sp. ESL0791]MDF7638061.1 4-hydroxy-tetrahydrodipicolinate reductase [Lactobacillus sp. ESL0791]
MIKVLVAGFNGAMGKQAVELVQSMPGYQVTAVFAPKLASTKPSDYHLNQDVKIFQTLAAISGQYDVWIDFTVPSAVYENTKFALEHKIRPVIGTSGLTDDQVAELTALAKQNKVGGLIAPNFGLSAVLLMKFAQIAAAYFPDAEVIEMHHADKQDAPSGTALKTAQVIAQSRDPKVKANFNDNAARGKDCYGVPVHSVRLPGYIAHEQVLFGGDGEALTIRQDSFDRHSFMHGVELALKNVMQLTGLVIGLENIL